MLIPRQETLFGRTAVLSWLVLRNLHTQQTSVLYHTKFLPSELYTCSYLSSGEILFEALLIVSQRKPGGVGFILQNFVVPYCPRL